MEVIILGAGGLVKQIIQAFELLEYNIKGLLDDNKTGIWSGYPILGTIKEYISGKDELFFCAIGDVRTREDIFTKFTGSWINCIHPSINLPKDLNIGIGNYIGPGVNIMPDVIIGDNNIIDPNAVISHDVCIGNHNHLAACSCILGRSKIGDVNLIGAHSTILPDLSIGNYNTLGAGAVNTKCVKDNKILIGVPAREMTLEKL